MPIPKFAKWIGRDAYNSWVANKFKAGAAELIDEVRNPTREKALEWAKNAAELATRAQTGRLLSDQQSKQLLSGGYDLGKAAWQGYQENVAKPGAGLIQATGLNPTGALLDTNPGSRLWARGLGVISRGGFDPGMVNPDVIAGGPSAWKQEADRDVGLTGAEKFGRDVAGDPMTYPLGGIAKAGLTAAGLPKAGLAAEAAWKLPGKKVGGLLDEAYQGMRNIPVLGQESIRSQGTQYGTKAANLLADLTSSLGLRGDQGDMKVVADLIQAVKDPNKASGTLPWRGRAQATEIINRYTDGGKDTRILDVATNAIRPANLKNVEGFTIGQVGSQPVELNLQTAMRKAVEEGRSGFIQAERQITKAKQAEKLATGTPQEKAVAWAQRTMDEVVNSKIGKGLGTANRWVNVNILGTPGYLLTNIPEDVTRAAQATGSVGSRSADEGLEYFRNLQSQLGRGEALPTDIPALARQQGEDLLSRQIGESGGFQPTSLGRRIANPGETTIGVSNRITEGVRRDAYIRTFDDALKKARAEGKSMQDALNQARDEANTMLATKFSGYGPETNLGRAAKAIFPFFGYEAHRLQYLPRAMAETPAIPATLGHLRENTDKGEIQIPGTDYSVDPTKGGVYSILSKLDENEFSPLEAQTYTTGTSGKIERGLQYLGEAGFYPNTAVNAAVAGIRSVQGEDPETGRLVPSTIRAGLGAAGATDIGPLDDVARRVQDQWGDDRFRRYAINQQLALKGIEPNKATPEQREQAAAEAGLQQFMTTMLGVMKYSPDEKKEFNERRIQMAIAAGVPEDIARKPGNPLTATDEAGNQFINAKTRKELYERDTTANPTGPNLATMAQVGLPLQQKEVREVNDQTTKMYDRLDQLKDAKEAELKAEYERYDKGVIDYSTFKARRADINKAYAEKGEEVKNLYPRAIKTPSERQAFYEKTGREFSSTPEDLAVQEYNEIQPEVDARTGDINFRDFERRRQEFLQQQPDDIRSYILKNKDKPFKDENMNRIESKFRQEQALIREYMNIPKYKGVSELDAEAIDDALAQASLLRQLNPRKNDTWIWAQVKEVNPRGALLARHASRLRNNEREVFKRKNPKLAILFGDVAPADMGGLLTETA